MEPGEPAAAGARRPTLWRISTERRCYRAAVAEKRAIQKVLQSSDTAPAERHDLDVFFCVLFDQCPGVFGQGGFGGGGGGCITGGMYSECHKSFFLN